MQKPPFKEIPNSWLRMLAAEEDTFSHQDALEFLKHHPLLLAITGKPVIDALGRGFEYSFPDTNIVPEAKERFEKIANQATVPVIRAFKLAFVYGAAGIGLVVNNEDPNKPIDTGWFSQQLENGYAISTFDSLITAGSFTANIDPNSVEFQKVLDFSVNGKKYHYSRCKVVFNPLEDPNYLQWESTAYGFVSASIIKRALPALQDYLLNKIAKRKLLKKVASFVHKQDAKSTVYDKITEYVAKIKRSKVEDLTSGEAVIIGTEESIESFNLSNHQQVMQFLSDDNMDDIANATGWQASYLKHAMLSTGMADGSNDAAQIDKMLYGVQNFTKPIFEWIDDILFYVAWTDSFIDSIALQYPDIYRGKTINQIRTLWRTGYERVFNPPTAEPAKDKAATDKTTVENISAIATLLQQVSSNQQLFDFVQNAFNTANILNGIEIDIDSSQFVQEQEPDMGMDDGQGME